VRVVLSLAMAAIALLSAAAVRAEGLSGDIEVIGPTRRSARGASVEKAGQGGQDASPVREGNPCALLEARLLRRRAWLAARREEQFVKGGSPDPAKGIPNMTAVFCEGSRLGVAVRSATLPFVHER
jgi:hypothetical protein